MCKDCKDAKIMDNVETKYRVIRSWWLSFGAATKGGMLGFSKWMGFWPFCYKQWGGHVLVVTVGSAIMLAVSGEQ